MRSRPAHAPRPQRARSVNNARSLVRRFGAISIGLAFLITLPLPGGAEETVQIGLDQNDPFLFSSSGPSMLNVTGTIHYRSESSVYDSNRTLAVRLHAELDGKRCFVEPAEILVNDSSASTFVIPLRLPITPANHDLIVTGSWVSAGNGSTLRSVAQALSIHVRSNASTASTTEGQPIVSDQHATTEAAQHDRGTLITGLVIMSIIVLLAGIYLNRSR